MTIDTTTPATKRPNWFARHKVLTGLAAGIAVIAIASSASGGGSADTAAEKPATSSSSPVEESKPATEQAPVVDNGPSTKFPMQDGDWRLDSFSVKDDGLGSFGGRGRITYTGDDTSGGMNVFTITVFKGGVDVGSLMGSASDVKPGTAETVQFISQDEYVAGSHKFTFQKDL